MAKIKVKCIGSLMSQKFFAGETYEIEKDFYDENKNCFIPLDTEEKQVMTSADIETKAPAVEETLGTEEKPKKKK